MCAVQYEKMGRVRSAVHTICFPAHVSHIALLPEVAFASAPVPICSKIREVYFDVNTTRSRHRSLSCGATRTFRNDAISGKRLTVLCDSDTPSVSVIRDGFASQHARLPCFPSVLNTVSFWSDLLLPEVCFDMHAAFSDLPGVWAARVPSVSVVSLLESLFQQLPWMLARHAAPVFHRYLVVSPSPSWPASVFLLIPACFHSLVMSSTCVLFDFHSHFSAPIVVHRLLRVYLQIQKILCNMATTKTTTTTWSMRPCVRPTVASTTTTRVTCSSQVYQWRHLHKCLRGAHDTLNSLIVRTLWCRFTPHWLKIRVLSFHLHSHPCAHLFESLFLFYFHLFFLVFFFSFHLLHCELYSVLDNLITMENLCYSANKGSCDVSISLTGYEPNFMAFSDLNDSSGSFSYMIPSSDQDMDDVTLGKLLTEAHQGQVDFGEPEGVSVSQSSWSVVFDRSGKPVGESNVDQSVGCGVTRNTYSAHGKFSENTQSEKVFDRSGKPVGESNVDQSVGCGVTRNTYSAHGKFSENTQSEKVVDWSGKPEDRNSSNAQIRTLLEEQRQMIIAEYCEKIGHHELQAARAEEERRLLREELWRQQMDFREIHQQSFTEMEELRKFQSSTFDTIARRQFIEDQNTIMKLSGRVQELHEVNCMNDSKDFQDAETVRSGNSHVTNRPVSFPPLPIPEGMLRHSFVSPRRKEGPPSIWDTHGFSGNVFCKSTCIFISSLSSRIERMECVNWGAATYVYSGEKWKTRTKWRSEMPVWTVSHRFSHSVEEILPRILGQTNNDCRFLIFTLTISLHQQPLPAGR